MGLTVSRRRSLGLAAAAGASLSTRRLRAADNADVIIIGAGLSGLQTAMLLEEIGLKVIVLEARNRVGGRVFTLTDKPQMPEGGGSEIGPMYARVLSMVERFGLNLEPWQIAGLNFMLHIGGQAMPPGDWPESPLNHVGGQAHGTPPFALSRVFLPKETGLPDLESWLDPAYADQDISLHEYYTRVGADAEALRFLTLAADADNLHEESLLWTLRKSRLSAFELTGEPFRLVVGGMSRLPEAMAASLKGDVHLNSPVSAIRDDNGSVTVTTAAGKALKARFAVCSVPLRVLQDIAIDPPLPPIRQDAVKTIPYGQAASVYFEITESYWDADGLGSSIWSDGPVGRAFNWATPNGKYLWVYLNGAVSRPIRNWDDEAIMAYTLRNLIQARPSMEGRISPIAVRNWSNDPYARGTFSHRAPGQITRFGNVAARPHGRVHFAGEHTALLQQGMEGAMESGERAALEIFDRL